MDNLDLGFDNFDFASLVSPDSLEALAPMAPLTGFLLIALVASIIVRGRTRAAGGTFVNRYFIGNRALGGFVLAMTTIATYGSVSSFVGGPGQAWDIGFGWVYMAVVQVTALVLLYGIFGKKMGLISRKLNAVTVVDVIRARYGSNALANLSALVIVLFFAATMVAQFVGGAKLFEAVTGYSYVIGLGLFGVAAALESKNDLGVHTEMLTSGMMRLAKLGVINGRRKQINQGKIVTTFAMGIPELYEFMDYNPSVAVMDGAWVNDPYTIAQNDNQVSINTSLEVDLTGQCASESIGSRQYSGTGGQADTAIGAQMSRGGKSIIALYSTAMVKDPATGEKREVSKIVPQLTTGAAVTLSRNDVDRVVTEYGVAELRGTSLRDRVARLIEIAHPKFREELWEQAVQVGILGKRR